MNDRVETVRVSDIRSDRGAFIGQGTDDATILIAKRAYELYEQNGRQEGHAVQDWLQAEREIREAMPPNK